jgi:hypothetical protein
MAVDLRKNVEFNELPPMRWQLLYIFLSQKVHLFKGCPINFLGFLPIGTTNQKKPK